MYKHCGHLARYHWLTFGQFRNRWCTPALCCPSSKKTPRVCPLHRERTPPAPHWAGFFERDVHYRTRSDTSRAAWAPSPDKSKRTCAAR